MICYDSITDKKKLDFKEVILKDAAIYSAENVYMTNKLYNKQQEDNDDTNFVIDEIETPLIEVLKKIELN
jgi:DNA polymerase I-like protein with 3'-5' exonuclease and polymerase domains